MERDRPKSVENAVRCFRRVLGAQASSARPLARARILVQLADAYADRTYGNKERNLEVASDLCRQALEVLSREEFPVDWARAQQMLGNCLESRLQDRSAHLEEAIACFRRALEVFSVASTPGDWGETMNNLGNALLVRVREDRSGNCEESIEAYEKSLSVLGKNFFPLEWSTAMTSVGVAYSERVLGDPVENLGRAIEAFQSALSVRQPNAFLYEWAETMLNLGAAYQDPRGMKRADGIELAIKTYRRILNRVGRHSLPLASAEATLNLGTAYEDRLMGDPDANLQKAIAAYRRALRVMTRRAMPIDWALVQFNLGEAFGKRRRGSRASNLRKAAESYEAALEIHNPELLPFECRRTARNLGEVYLQAAQWQAAARAYRLAIRASERLYRASLLASSREAELSVFPDLYRHAAYVIARAGRRREAAVILERGRAQEIGEGLARDRVDLEEIRRKNSPLCERYTEAAGRVRAVELQERGYHPAALRGLVERRGLEPLRAEARQARMDLDAVIAEIRLFAGHSDFLVTPDISRITERIRPGLAIVYINVTPAGGQVLVLAGSRRSVPTVKVLWIDSFSSSDLERLLAVWRLPEGPRDATTFETLRCLRELVAPFAAILRKRDVKRAVLIPCGPLSLLPLHAVPFRGGADQATLLDEIDVVYMPSARLLAVAEDALHSLTATAPRLVGVGGPAESGGSGPLAFARGELTLVSQGFPLGASHLLFGEQATKRSLLDELPAATHVHLACHGSFVPDDPFASFLLLAGGEALSLREILTGQSLACTRLAVLSACQTAMTDVDRLPDEAIGMTSVFLQAGVPGVIGTLWQVDDLSTALLMVRFYDLHLRGVGAGPLNPARALRLSQLWLRDVTAGELIAFFQDQRRRLTNRSPSLEASAIAAGLSRFALEEPESRPFLSPYHWAPFIFLGA